MRPEQAGGLTGGQTIPPSSRFISLENKPQRTGESERREETKKR